MVENVTKLMTIVRREYTVRVTTRWFVISTLLAPLLFAMIAFLPIIMISRDASAVAPRLVILDATGTGLGRDVRSALRAERAPRADTANVELENVAPAALASARARSTREVVQRLATGFVVLDSATLAGDSVRYAGRHADSRSEAAAIANAVKAGLVAMRLRGSGVAEATVDSIAAMPAPPLAAESINDSGRDVSTPAKAILATMVAFFLYMSTVLYGQSMLSGVIEEKLSRVSEIVLSSVSPDTLLAGKVLGVTAVGITQQVVWVVLSFALVSLRGVLFGAGAASANATQAAGAASPFGSAQIMAAIVATPWSWVLLVILFYLLGSIFYGALYAAVGATVGSEQEARQASQPVIMLLVVTAVFISPIVQNPNSGSARIMSLLPFSSPIIMPLRMAMTTVPLSEQIGSLVILGLGCAGAVWIAARIYRIGLLMYGKRPSFRELRRWIAAS